MSVMGGLVGALQAGCISCRLARDLPIAGRNSDVEQSAISRASSKIMSSSESELESTPSFALENRSVLSREKTEESVVVGDDARSTGSSARPKGDAGAV